MNTEIIITFSRDASLSDLEPMIEEISTLVSDWGYANDPETIDDPDAKLKSIISIRDVFMETEEDAEEWITLLAQLSEIIVMPLTQTIDNNNQGE